MMLLQTSFLLALSGSQAALHPRASRLEACPLLGKEYPPPIKLRAEPKIQHATKTLDSTLSGLVKQPPYRDTTFSVGMFSAFDDGLFYQYHHTGPLVANSSYGVNKVDANSIYRIGSISKLLTIYLFLLCEGDVRWSDPVSKHLPQLLSYKAESWNDMTPDWQSITVGDLAGQMGGLARDYGLTDAAPTTNAALSLPESIRAAFPKIPESQAPKCGWQLANQSIVQCTIEEYLSGVANESPIFAPAYTPVYSNEAFAIIGQILSNLADQPIEELFNDKLVKTVGLKSTYYDLPPSQGITDRGVIPVSPEKAGWSTIFSLFSPAGGYLSTVNDFATMGKAILTNGFLSKSVTNRWMKPTTFVESWSSSVGRPWEIFRLKVNGKSVDWYSKSGDWGVYHTFFGLLPDYDIGITVLTAETLTSSGVRDFLPFTLADLILPVVDEIAKDQAETNFGGHYSSAETNTSLKLSTDGIYSGLKVTELISKGVDLFAFFDSEVPNLVWRLIPNGLSCGEGKIGFTSFQASAVSSNSTQRSILDCPGWLDVDPFVFGNIPMGQMVFNVDESGKASSVDLRGLRLTLDRQS